MGNLFTTKRKLTGGQIDSDRDCVEDEVAAVGPDALELEVLLSDLRVVLGLLLVDLYPKAGGGDKFWLGSHDMRLGDREDIDRNSSDIVTGTSGLISIGFEFPQKNDSFEFGGVRDEGSPRRLLGMFSCLAGELCHFDEP